MTLSKCERCNAQITTMKAMTEGDLPARSMAQADLIAQTPRGSSIQKIEAGKFLVCDRENVCFFTRSLYLAEEQLEEMELGYRFPYSTNFRKAPA